MKKYDIINALGRRHNLRRYLEICTPTTGHTYARVDGVWFQKERLVYNCPDTNDDGMEYSYRTSQLDSSDLVKAIERTKPRGGYDLIFIDPFHTLHASATDLSGAWNLLRPMGIMVVHDCNPADEEIAAPEFKAGDWCGVTYQAFINFVLGRSDLDYCTVDADYGCGVIFKRQRIASEDHAQAERDAHLARGWLLAQQSDRACYKYFDGNRRQLLRLVAVEEFTQREGIGN
ncbi:MAG: hypothetical protein GC190_18435 [Alphaproteobacteria bacterium]|nr:hypothetical protein [Alphaproteobacteria bacterium]